MEFDKILQKQGVLSVIKIIQDKHGGVITSNEAIRILYKLCSLFTKHEQLYEANVLFDLIILCCKNVGNLKEAEVNPFLMSVYHFMKHFFKLKLLDYVSILCNQVQVHCVDEQIKSDMYCYYVQILTREIFANARAHDGDLLQQTILFSIKCELLLNNSDVKALCGRLISYPLLFRHSHITNEQRNNFCLNFMRTLRTIELKNDISIDVFKALVNIFYITVFNITNCEKTFPVYIQNTLEEIITTMYELFKKEFNSSVEILSLVFQALIKDVTNFNKKSATKLQQCNELIDNHAQDQIIAITCSLIGKTLKILIEYYERVRDAWTDYFPFEELFKLYELIENVVSKNTFDVEKCCMKCNLKTDIFNSISSSAVCVEFVNAVLRQKRADCLSSETHQRVVRLIQKCSEHVQSLQRNQCEKYAAFWKFLGLHTYNIGVTLYKVKNYASSKLYTDVFLRNIVLIEGTTKTNVCFKDAIGAALHLHSTNCMNLQQINESMVYLVATMLLSKDYRKKAMWTWVLIKSDQQSDDEIKAITVKDVLYSQQDQLKSIIPRFKYEPKSAEELLIFELHYYAENWLSRIPIISSCNEILKISTDIFVQTKALLLSYDKFLVMFDPRIISSVEATIDAIKSKPCNFSYNICLSLLKFILYQFKLHELILKNLEDMNKAYIPLKSVPLQPYEEPPNPNDKCDIVPAFINLNLDSLLKLYENLDSCVELWSSIVERNLTQAELLLISDYKVLKIIKASAFEFRLHHYQMQMVNTWILYYKVAEILGDKLGMLEGIAYVLEYADSRATEIVQLDRVAQGLIKDLDRQNRGHMNCLTNYYVNKSAGCFKNGLVVEAYEHFCLAEQCFELSDNKEDINVSEARLLHLRTHFLLVPCTYEILNHQENVLIAAQAAYTCIAEIYKINTLKCAYTTSILFEISLSNGWIYKHLRLPREVRSYSKESVMLAQKCLLPMRTAQFLSLLAFTDLLDRQYMDCEVKLSGLLKILCSSNSQDPINPVISVTACKEDTNTDIYCDTEGHTFFQTVLHVPTPEPQRITSSELGSPNLRRKPFICPDFVTHARNCDCYLCRNYEYQKLIFDTVHLESLINFYQGDRKQAESFFNGGILLHKKIQAKIQSSNPITLIKSSKFIFKRLCRNISINYCTFLLDYSYFLLQKSDFQNASKILDNITLNNDHLKYTCFPFWNEVILQKTNISIQKEKQIFAVKKCENNVEPELLVVVNTIVSTTPENKTTKNPIAVCISPGIKSKHNRRVKKIQFDLSDSDSEQENKVDNIEKEKSPINNYFKLKTPGKTPAPKIKIYTPKTVKHPKRTGTTSVSKNAETEKASKGQEKLVKKTLEERTKLLTEKLKASQKKNPVGGTTKKSAISKKDELKNITDSIEKLNINPKEPAKKKYNRIKQPNFSSSSLSSIDSPEPSTKNKVLGSRIKKMNLEITPSSGENVTRKSTRSKK